MSEPRFPLDEGRPKRADFGWLFLSRNADPETRVKGAAYLMFLLSSLGFIVGIGGYVFGVDFMKSPRAIVMAALFVVVGLFTLRRSRAVLLLGMVVYALEGILTSITLFSESRRVNVGLLVVHVVVLFVMFRGLQGIRALTAARTSQGVV